jgi:outer membrane protein
MRKSLTAGAFGGFLFAALAGATLLPVQQAAPKFGYIDSQAVIAAYPGTVEAKATFDAENQAWQRQASALEQEVTQMQQQLERQSLAMSEERRAQLTAELQRKALEYQNFLQEIWGQEGRAYLRNQELMQPIIDRVNVLLETVGQEGVFDFILDAASGSLVYADPKFDLTPTIIERLSGDAPDRD